MKSVLFFKYLVFFICITLLVACDGSRAVLWHGIHATPSMVAVQQKVEKPIPPKAIIPVYVATSRMMQDNYSQPYGAKRSNKVYYNRVDVGIPQKHVKGVVETNAYKPSHDKYFAAVALQKYDNKEQFKQQLNIALAKKPKGKKEIFLFIHGYNNNFADGTFRTAQFAYDYSLNVVNVHYSWPSAGAIPLYIYDRDSANFARDGLIELLMIISETKADQVSIIAHSMGNLVTMEAFRTLALQGKYKLIHRITSFLMAAPDIDLDVFERQLNDIKQLPQPTAILVSRKDKALAVSRKLTGGHPRVGDGSNIEILRKNGIAILDLSNVDGGTHNVFASSPTLMALSREGSLASTIMQETELSPSQAILSDGSNILKKTTDFILYTPMHLLSPLTNP
ncbi:MULTISPECIES: alpha/beta hydrolase [unclassified Bartonella]|uniref:alpha/beta hydrolase n=1 Tax=unclassified Bartonella TaxID=2645622 RepID=UPI00099ABEF4|nr:MULTISPECIES: alpha/beta hydrolase [unclassified Bartonella]AQX28067.1 Esterase/lipase superfamily enzyme [Bartonella sp. JB15]AQX29339.1 Esterase/lipase superfamily enzyme [Bartonella sp. JB63]